jgi:hypothetical protein
MQRMKFWRGFGLVLAVVLAVPGLPVLVFATMLLSPSLIIVLLLGDDDQ